MVAAAEQQNKLYSASIGCVRFVRRGCVHHESRAYLFRRPIKIWRIFATLINDVVLIKKGQDLLTFCSMFGVGQDCQSNRSMQHAKAILVDCGGPHGNE